MKIAITAPLLKGMRTGNRGTASRWQQLLRDLGHEVSVIGEYDDRACDLLIALHARKSARAAIDYCDAHPHGPLIVCLGGTDLYGDLPRSSITQRVTDMADRLILLQKAGRDELWKRAWKRKARVIIQSSVPPTRKPAPLKSCWEVTVVAALRAVKDPLRTAMAARSLPTKSNIHVAHLGAAYTPAMEKRALAETARNDRYTWLDEVSHAKTLARIARSRLLVLTSKSEGGANVISEAIVCGVPVIASRIPGSVGLLGAGYPGYFEVGQTRELTNLLHRAETDSKFYQRLCRHCEKLEPKFTPDREQEAWRKVIAEIT